MKEVFRIIEGYNGRYQISNYGNVYSAQKKSLMTPYKFAEFGQYYVGLRLKSQPTKHVPLGKLVLQYFRPSQIPQQCVLHFDLNLENNMSNNLTYGSRSGRLKEARRIRNKPRGVYAYLPRKTGEMTYRASLDHVTLGYSRDREECELMYLAVYLGQYGVLPYTEQDVLC